MQCAIGSVPESSNSLFPGRRCGGWVRRSTCHLINPPLRDPKLSQKGGKRRFDGWRISNQADLCNNTIATGSHDHPAPACSTTHPTTASHHPSTSSTSSTANPFPKYPNRFPFIHPSYVYTQSSPLNPLSIRKKCSLLPGCSAVTGSSAVPPLYHDRHDPAHAVRGMKASMCAPSSATARADGSIAAMPSVWHFWMMRVMYAAMCSVSVKTLPWPMGALGPRKAVFVDRGRVVVSVCLLLSRRGAPGAHSLK